MSEPHLYNAAFIKIRRRDLRKNLTDAERKLWSVLRSKQMSGLKFFRQYSVGPYILDFYCPKYRLAIEVDGGQHAEDEQRRHDEKRTDYLKQQNIWVLRFWDNEVLTNLDGVVEKITKKINNHS